MSYKSKKIHTPIEQKSEMKESNKRRIFGTDQVCTVWDNFDTWVARSCPISKYAAIKFLKQGRLGLQKGNITDLYALL